jgi:uncharacterized protein (UPF0276 family)
LRRDYPIAVHGVGLSLGSVEGLDARHLERMAALVSAIEPCFVSEHLAWSVTGGHYLADLLPLPMTEEALEVVCGHVMQTQERLGRNILLENPSSYVQFTHSTIPEWEFLATIATRTGCALLCDVNNIFVSASNHGWDPLAYLRALRAETVAEYHLAGHAERALEDGRVVRIDDHGSRVSASVWALYGQALTVIGPRPTLIEWDTQVPPLSVLLEEARIAAGALNAAQELLHARAA